jgi:DNA-directed RNA polymerase-3 subunit RPC5
VKPFSSEVEVDLSINTQSENYDQEAPLRLTKQVSLFDLAKSHDGL